MNLPLKTTAKPKPKASKVGLYSKAIVALVGMLGIIVIPAGVDTLGLDNAMVYQLIGALIFALVVAFVPERYRGQTINLLEIATKIDINKDGKIGNKVKPPPET